MTFPCFMNHNRIELVMVTGQIQTRNHRHHTRCHEAWRERRKKEERTCITDTSLVIGSLLRVCFEPANSVRTVKRTFALQELPVYHPTPSQARMASQLTEEEQVRIAQRIGLIHHLPKGVYDAGRDGSEKKIRECVICMTDFVYGDPIRFLPCMHIYHMDCIDDWLMRSFTCPSCMEPVDAALLSSYETN
ncbi:RING finger protein 11 isoform X1 [Oncorhynchus tshawytscha]|uniref:RING finger protein 11 n=2 Tax=Oncorhynchus TaxID=8016 RepID=A0A8C7F089_ONCKI|nr:RING finger protein 11 isoform X1 [Oncorhynchus tshawytscha]XP_031689216.1 RING finger protein 11 isoform X1 [Oncorhynchus kisutch]